MQAENLNKNLFKCNICYDQPGLFILCCSCLYCKGCLKDFCMKKMSQCFICNKQIELSKTIDLTKKEAFAKYSFMFSDPELIIKKGLESLAFQKNYQKKQLEYLKAKVEVNENKVKEARESVKYSAYNNVVNSSLFTTEKQESKPFNILDELQIKKVSPKYSSKPDLKESLKIKNLNAQTVNRSVDSTNNNSRDNSCCTKEPKRLKVNINDMYKTPLVNKDFSDYYYKK